MKRILNTLFLLGLCAGIWAQIAVQGTVVDDKGEPVIGASVVVRGTTEGTVTDIDGHFALSVAQGAKLVVSYVGYKTTEVSVQNSDPVKVTLSEDSELLEDVVVIGYGTVRKSDLTGAISSVKTEEMNMSTSTLEQALIGHTPGVEIKQTSGAPGAGTTIHIRGVNSVYGGVEPLYVVDGFPASKDVFINPSDVESIEVLKDAASAAIYGSRAGGGVILITTKRGAEGKPKVQLDYQFSMQQVQRKVKMMNAAEFKQLHMDGYNNNYFDFLRNNPSIYGSDDAVNWYHSRTDDNATRIATGAPNINTMLLCPDIIDSDYDTDWQDEIFRNAPMHKVNFSVSGGKDKFKYMFSAGYLNQDGIVAPSNHQRVTSRLNMDINVTDRFTVGVNTNMYYVKERVVRTDGLAFNDGVILNALGMPPTYPAYNEDGSYALGWSYRNGETSYMCFGGENPVAIANGREEYYTKMRASINTNLSYKIYNGLFIKLNGGVQIADQIYNLYRPSWLGQSNYAPGNYETNSLVVAKDNRDFNTDWLLEATVSYDNTFADKHTISAVVGYSMQKKVYNNIDAATVLGALPDDRITELSAAKPTETDENGTSAKTDKIAWSLMSVFGRAMYNYDHRYTVSVTLRGDGCSRFGKNNRWGLFPSVSAGWNITNEHWAEHIQDIYTAKLRASWGISGNNNISNYRHIATIKQGSYVFGSDPAAVVTYYPTSVDQDLGWEKTSQVNVGTDMTFWSGRLSLVMNYYYSKTTDLLYQNTVSAVTGATSMWTNLDHGRVINQGGDFQVDANVINMAGVKWNIGFNISLNRNRVYGLDDDILIKAQRQQLTHITRNGYAIGSYYGMVSEGIINADEYALICEDAKHVGEEGYELKGPAVSDYKNVYVGDVKWKDVNGDGKITEDDRDIIGNNYPKFSYGFNTSISWKGLSFSMSFDGQYGNQVINFSRYYICNLEGGVNSMSVGLNRYRGEYTQPYAVTDDMMFRANRSQKNLNTKFSTYFVEDASFLRMTNLTLGYTIPDNKAFKAIHLSKFYLYFSVDNVFTATKYTGYNPDVDYNASNTAPGLDFGTYPLARSFSGGIKLTF
ncbi:MAG: TonB-dependent receptor [Paludibacteraceae bacterium]|nr:TonB-dependent receptor [Paludibacteraceae bacterium]